MKQKLFTRRRWLLFGLVVLAVVLGPYIASRIASSSRRVSLHELEPSAEQEATGLSGATSSGSLRVLCYNIAHGRGVVKSNWDGGNAAERAVRLDEIAAQLREIGADIVVLNEVDFQSSWSGSENQARTLARLAGYKYWAEQRNLDFRVLGWTWCFGNAVLSNYPIDNAEVVDLPEYSPWETWSAGKKRGVACEIRIDARRKVQLVGVHLSHRSEALRIRSAEMLIDMAKESRYPLIVVGDLNSTPPDLPKAAFDEAGNNAMATFDKASQLQRIPISLPLTENDMTFHSSKPSRVIDWILIPPNWRFDEYQVIHSPLSDHRAVCADVSAGEVNSQASESPK